MATTNYIDMMQPDLVAQQDALTRKQQLIDYLRQQSLQPINPSQMVETGGGAPNQAVAISPWQGLSKMAQAYFAGSQQPELTAQQSALGKQRMQGLEGILNRLKNGDSGGQSTAPQAASGEPLQGVLPAPDGTLYGDTGKQSTPLVQALRGGQQQTTGGPTNGLGGAIESSIYNSIDPAYNAFRLDQLKLPEAVKTNNFYGLGKQEVADTMRRENMTKGQQVLRGDNTLTRTNADGSVTPIFTAPDPKSGINTTWNNGVPSASIMPGMEDVTAKMAAALKAGQNQQTLAPPDMSPTLPNGQIVPTTVAKTINPGVSQSGYSDPNPEVVRQEQVRIISGEYNKETDPAAKAALGRELTRLGSPQGVGPAFGQSAGAVNAQTELTKKFSDLQQQNSQAQITSSYLQNIKQQAQKAAVGPMSDKLDYVNGLLSMVGNQKATDAVTANDLLEKYSNQIVSRLGQGGLGTDAARSILQSAYPNAKMNLQAINDAADNLVGSNEMVKAKTSLLSPHGNARDPVAYQQKEQIFDQNADPRIWQYKAMRPGSPEAKMFLQNVIKQDPSFIQKAQKLQEIGAF